MRLPSIVCLLSCAALTPACGILGPDSDLNYAVATQGCGPADGPTTVILLASDPIKDLEPSFPYVGISIWEPVTAIAGRNWDITGNTGPGAWYRTAFGQSGQSATSGRVTVTSVDATNKVEGSVDLRFPGRTVVTEFSAPWRESFSLCGWAARAAAG